MWGEGGGRDGYYVWGLFNGGQKDSSPTLALFYKWEQNTEDLSKGKNFVLQYPPVNSGRQGNYASCFTQSWMLDSNT